MSRLFVMDTALEIGGDHHLFVPRRERLVAKGHSNFLQCMASSFDVVPVSKASGEQAEASNDEVKVAADPSESIWRYHADDEIENPVGCLDDSQWRMRALLGYQIVRTVASAMPLLRLRRGKISAGRSHGIGPQVMP